MKARIPQTPNMDEVQKLFAEKLKQATVHGVLLGGQTHARIAMENWGNAYRAATSQDEKIRIADELIAYIERTAKGAEDKKDEES